MRLRAVQREKRRAAILRSAGSLFRKKGYEETSQEQIAWLAEVSPGTLYNYFPSKADLLLALVDSADEFCIAASQAVIESPPRNPVAALAKIATLASEHSIRQLDKSVWRHVMAASYTNARSEFGQRYAATTERLRQLTVKMLEKLQERGDLRPDFDPAEVGYYLHSMKHALFCHFITSDSMTIENHLREVRRAVATLAAGLRSDESAAPRLAR